MNVRVVLFMALMVSQAYGQTPAWTPYPPAHGYGHIDRPAVPMDQAADVIVVLVPDESDDGACGGPHDCIVRASSRTATPITSSARSRLPAQT